MNRQLKHKVPSYDLFPSGILSLLRCFVYIIYCCSILQLEAEGCSNYRTLQHAAAWPAPGGTMVEHDGATYHVHPPAPSAAMDCEPTLQIGYNFYLIILQFKKQIQHVALLVGDHTDQSNIKLIIAQCTNKTKLSVARYPHHQFLPSEAANNIPRSAPGGENNFMLGWVL